MPVSIKAIILPFLSLSGEIARTHSKSSEYAPYIIDSLSPAATLLYTSAISSDSIFSIGIFTGCSSHIPDFIPSLSKIYKQQ